MSEKFSILVNTTDSFEDCWEAFFKLFSYYWPEYKGKIYLNTEFKEFKYEKLNIISVRNNLSNKKSSWSQCLLKALYLIDNDIILYLQEDYFFNNYVQNNLIEHFSNIINENDIDCIHLTDQNSIGPFNETIYTDLWEINKNAPYRVSCQAALWKKESLIKCINIHENPWQFENFGTKRSRKLDLNFYSINRDIFGINKKEIIPYIFTGIIQGKWKDEVIPLFENHGIYVNLTKRGFFNNRIKKNILSRILVKLKNIPAEIKSYIGIFLIKQ